MEKNHDEEMENPISVRQLTRFSPGPYPRDDYDIFEARMMMRFFERLIYKRHDTISVESSDSYVSMFFTSRRDWGEARLPFFDREPSYSTETRLVIEFFKLFQILVGNDEEVRAGYCYDDAPADVVIDYCANYLNILEVAEKVGAKFSKKAITDAFWVINKRPLHDLMLYNWGVKPITWKPVAVEEKQYENGVDGQEKIWRLPKIPIETPLDSRGIDPAMVQKLAAEKMGTKKSHKVKFFAEDFAFPLDPFPEMILTKLTEKTATVFPKQLKMFYTELLRLRPYFILLKGAYEEKDGQVAYVVTLYLDCFETTFTNWKGVLVIKSDKIEDIRNELAAFEEEAFLGLFDLLMDRNYVPPSVVSSLNEPKRVVTPGRQAVKQTYYMIDIMTTWIHLGIVKDDVPWKNELWIKLARKHWGDFLAKNEDGRRGGVGGKRLPQKAAVVEEDEKLEADVSSGDEYLPPPAKKLASLEVESNPIDTDTSATPPPATPIAKKKAPKKKPDLSSVRAPSSRATTSRRRGTTLPCVPSVKQCVDHLEGEDLGDQTMPTEGKATETIYTAQSFVDHVFSAPYFKSIAAFFEALLIMTDMEMKYTMNPAKGKRNVKKGSSEVTVTFQTSEGRKEAFSTKIPSELLKGDKFEYLLAATFNHMRDEFVIDGETAAAVESGLQDEAKLVSLARYTEKFLRCRLQFSDER